MTAAPRDRWIVPLTRVWCRECRTDSLLAAVYHRGGNLQFWTPSRQSRARQMPGLAEVLGERGKWRSAPIAWPLADDLPPTIATVSCAHSGHVANVDLVLAARNARAGAEETPSESLHVESKDCQHVHVRFAIELAYLDPNRASRGG